MRGNQYTIQPKIKPSFGQEQPRKQSLASILQKYERDLCEDVFLKLGNDLPVVEMIQAEKLRKPMTAGVCTAGRQSTDQRLFWSKRQQGKENTAFEQHMQGNSGISPVSHKNAAQGDRFRKKSPLNAKAEVGHPPSNLQNNENLVFKAKEGKLGSLKDMLNEFPTTKDFRQSTSDPFRKQTSPAVPPRFTTPCNAPTQRKLQTPQQKPRLMESVRAPPEEEIIAQIEPSILLQDLGLEGLELSQEEMSKVSQQMKHLQETLIGILGHAKIHPTPEILRQIKQEVAAQVREFARNLLSDRANSQRCSKVESNAPDSSFLNSNTDNVQNQGNRSLFFSFQSPISAKPDQNIGQDELNLPMLLPDKPEPVEQVIELENPPQANKIVSNVAMVISKQMTTSKGSEPDRQTTNRLLFSKADAPLFPSIKLEGFDWLRPSEPVVCPSQQQAAMGFRVDLGLNNSSDLDLCTEYCNSARTINND